jgi:hypothetical protein
MQTGEGTTGTTEKAMVDENTDNPRALYMIEDGISDSAPPSARTELVDVPTVAGLQGMSLFFRLPSRVKGKIKTTRKGNGSVATRSHLCVLI